MRLLNRLTIKNLKLNKKRTFVTIIGIILATFLLTSVITIISSFQKSLLEYNRKISGDFHYEFLNVPISDLNTIIDNENVEDYFITQTVGLASLKEFISIDAPLEIIGFSQEALNKLGIQLEEGRLPQNENEIVISSTLKKYQDSELKIGNDIDLTFNSDNNNNIHTYTIVGTVNITDINIEPADSSTSNASKYVAITYLGNGNFNLSDTINLYIKFADLNTRINTAAQILGIDEEALDVLTTHNRAETEENLLSNETNKYAYIINNNLISMEAGDFIDETTTMLYASAGVILLIIVLTSVYCIRNSFDISITEKIKQYGTLSSIGATSKQIRKNVFQEAFILGIISIPIGIFLGIISVYILLKVIEVSLSKNLFGMQFIFSTNIIAILIIALLSCFILYLSARKSAKKAAKLSPIEAIRSNKSIVIKAKNLKSPKIIKKLFGIGGEIAYKNIKRNKKPYRTTIVSIIVSITLFITAISFTKYATIVSEIYIKQDNYSIFMSSNNYEKLKNITQDIEINKYDYELMRINYVDLIDGEKHYTEDVSKIDYNKIPAIVSLGQQEYERYLKKLDLTYNEAKDKIILMDITTESIEENGKTTYQSIDFYDYIEGEQLSFYYNDKIKQAEIIKVTSETPMVLSEGPHAYLIVSDEFMDQIWPNNLECFLYIQTPNDIELENYIQDNYSDAYWIIGNHSEERREQQALSIIILVFLYGFILVTTLIGITNIFNTITTNMELRQREFAHLKAIGMTRKEFNRMIKLESLFYGIKALFIGIPLGLLFSYFLYLAFSINIELDYFFPLSGIIICIIVVIVLISSIMKYSLNKINKQNIIETMHRENI